MKSVIFTVCLCFTNLFLYAQNTQNLQWASRLLGFSSEYSEETNKNPYSAKQVLGKPNKLPITGFSPVAWFPNLENKNTTAWIKVGFKTPINIQQIAIAENCGAGAITHIYIYDTENIEYLAYQDSAITTKKNVGNGENGRMFKIFLPLTSYKVAAIKIILNPMRVNGKTQIDAIGISDSKKPITAEINLPENKQDSTSKIIIEKLPATINSNYNELMPVISADGKTLFFDRQMHPENTEGQVQNDDIWFSEIDTSGTWKESQRLPKPLNNENNNYVCAISPDGNTMLVANHYDNFDTENPVGGVSITYKNAGGKWQNPEKVIIENYYNLSANAEFYLAHNQKTLLMSIEQNDSEGGRDLYVSFYRHDTKTWTSPKNLGTTINSAATELTPFLAADNQTLYFSSNGISGYGETDMFFCKRLDDSWTNWTEPTNMGKPLNSADWDAAYSLDAQGEYAYYISYQTNNSNNTSNSDIFRAKLPISLKPAPIKKIDLALNSLTVGQTIQLQHIIFEQGTAQLLEESNEELTALIKLLNENPSMEIEVAGHTDIDGSPIENMKLSQERVKTMKSYLVKRGINASRIRTKAWGSQKPISKNRDEVSKQLNRRVELKVLKF